MPKKLKLIFVNMLVFGVLLELVSFVAIHFYYIAPYPEAYVKTYQNTISDSNPVFGVWHPKNVQTKSFGPCWRVNYAFNSFGARDKQREIKSVNKRFVLIGDSFFEGYGVTEEDRFQNRLEERTGLEFLSFGTSGNFGPTQMSLLYDSLASKFDHDYLIVSFFPFNDFYDDSWESCKVSDQYKKRYRPYYDKDSIGNYNLMYHLPRLEDSEWYGKKSKRHTLLSQLKEIVYSPNSLRAKLNFIHKSYFFSRSLLGHFIRTNAYRGSSEFKTLKSSVFQEIKLEELERWKYVMSLIKERAQGRPIIVLTIAHPLDYIELERSGVNLLSGEIDKFCDKNEFKHIDLLRELTKYENKAELSLPCDGHWSSKGNEVVSEIVYQKLKSFGYFK